MMKHYRIVRLAGLHYKTPMLALYKNNPELKSQSYADQQKVLFQTGSVYSDSFSRGMKSLGHDAHEIVHDSEILQKTWAEEKGIKYDEDNWEYSILLAQIEDLKPAVVYFQGTELAIPGRFVKANQQPEINLPGILKDKFPFIKLVVMFSGFPSVYSRVENVDVLFVGTPTLVKHYEGAGLTPHLMYHFFDDAILERIGAGSYVEPNPKYDFTFVGSSGFGHGRAHQSRYWALVELIERTSLEAWVRDRVKGKTPIKVQLRPQLRKSLKGLLGCCGAATLDKMLALSFMPNKARRVLLEVIEQKRESPEHSHSDITKDNQRLPTKPLRKMFPHRSHGPVFGIDMYRVLRQSKVTFNRHVDAAEDSVGNMRMFEATGVGTCLLTDTGKNMSDLFEPDKEAVTYRSIDEAVEKAKYLLEHDDVRRQIAAAGQRRTLKDHTVMNRCQQIDDILQKML